MSLGYELRRSPRHAIGEFTATVQTFNAVSAGTFSEVIPALKHIAETLNLPAVMALNMFQLALGQSGVTPASPQPLASAGYQRFAPDGEIVESLVCDSNSVTYTSRDYSNWPAIKSRFLGALSTLVRIYAKEAPALDNVRIQYVNEFKATSPVEQSARELFREGTAWVPSFHMHTLDAWHSHVGAFIDQTGNKRHLINVNCDVSRAAFPTSQSLHNYAKVLVLAGCYYNIPGLGPLIIEPASIYQVLDHNFEEAHHLEKGVLSQVIADQYLAAMGA